MDLYPPRMALAPRAPANQAISQRGWGFQTVLGGIDPGDRRFRARNGTAQVVSVPSPRDLVKNDSPE